MTCLPLDVPDGPAQQIAIDFNDVPLDVITLLPGQNRYTVTLPREQFRRWRNLVTFRYAYTRRPRDLIQGSEDARDLAVAWYSIGFAEKDEDASVPNRP